MHLSPSNVEWVKKVTSSGWDRWVLSGGRNVCHWPRQWVTSFRWLDKLSPVATLVPLCSFAAGRKYYPASSCFCFLSGKVYLSNHTLRVLLNLAPLGSPLHHLSQRCLALYIVYGWRCYQCYHQRDWYGGLEVFITEDPSQRISKRMWLLQFAFVWCSGPE